jgi:hypothetical protein
LAAAGCFKGVLVVIDPRLGSLGPGDRDDVEPAGALEEASALEPYEGGAGELFLLGERDGLGGVPGSERGACFHFDEDDPLSVQCNQVNLADETARLPGEDAIALLAEKSGSSPLSSVAEQLPQPADLGHWISRLNHRSNRGSPSFR